MSRRRRVEASLHGILVGVGDLEAVVLVLGECVVVQWRVVILIDILAICVFLLEILVQRGQVLLLSLILL